MSLFSGPPGWRLLVYRDAGEATGTFQGLDDQPISGGGPAWPDLAPGRSAEEAGRRARAKVRRYCASNGLNRLGTLTYAGEGCHDPRQARADVGRYFRQLRRSLGGEPFPYLWVPELHKSGHGFHFHFAVGRFIRRGLIDEAWGHGFVHIKLLGNLPVGSGVREEARVAAGYVSKYISKDLAGRGGLNRYDVAQGFQPKTKESWLRTEEEAIAAAKAQMGCEPRVVWRSKSKETWRGPQTVWLQWR